MVFKIKVVYLHCQTITTGRFPRTLKFKIMSIYEYVTFGEYDAKTIRNAVLETGYYGEIYKWLYYQSKK